MKVLVFILLKIVEIAAIVFIPWLVGSLDLGISSSNNFEKWIFGMCTICLVAVALGLLALFTWILIEVNLDLVRLLGF